MRQGIKRWVDRQLASRRFAETGDAWRFAWQLALRVVVVTNAMALTIYFTLHHFNLLLHPLKETIIFGVSMTTAITLPVTATFAHCFANAIRHTIVSRDQFERLSSTDMLSGLMNRRSFLRIFESADAGAVFVIFDIDHFKRVNDTWGHAAGDFAIVEVARILSEVFAGSALAVARFGGEEFTVLVDRESSGRAADLFERARAQIAAKVLNVDGKTFGVTVSAGTGDVVAGRNTLEIYKAADRALYIAKASGRNRVVHESDVAALGDATDAHRRAAG